MTPDQLAEKLHCSTRHLERMRREGTGPAYVRLGKLVRYPVADVRAYLEGRRAVSTSEEDARATAA